MGRLYKLILPLILCLCLCGCGTKAQKRKADYCYRAKSENYSFEITPTALTLSRLDEVWAGKAIVVEGETATFCGLSENIAETASLLCVGKLMYKIFMNEILTQAEKSGEHLQITGSWQAPFTLMLDKKTLEPYMLCWLGENILFE